MQNSISANAIYAAFMQRRRFMIILRLLISLQGHSKFFLGVLSSILRLIEFGKLDYSYADNIFFNYFNNKNK